MDVTEIRQPIEINFQGKCAKEFSAKNKKE